MSDSVSLMAAAGCAILLGFVAGFLALLRRQRRQVDSLCTVHKRQMGLSARRLAEANARLDASKKEVLMLEKELAKQQARWRRANGAVMTGVAGAVVQPPPPRPVQPVDEPGDDASGFAPTQPWERGPA